jgi:hypothetical protein
MLMGGRQRRRTVARGAIGEQIFAAVAAAIRTLESLLQAQAQKLAELTSTT